MGEQRRRTKRTDRTWGVYARLSRKATQSDWDDAETVERQQELAAEFAEDEGLTIDPRFIYVDNHRSAWKSSEDGGKRAEWNRMIEDLSAGKFDGLLVYKLDRFARNTPDNESLVRAARRNAFIVGGPRFGFLDPNTADGRKRLREAAVAGAYESDNSSERITDAISSRVERGLQLGGGRLYGYEILSRVRSNKRDVTPRIRESEAKIIREVAAWVIEKKTSEWIADRLNERGLVTARGNAWSKSSVVAIVKRPANAGLRVDDEGNVIGHMQFNDEDGNPCPPILDRDVYERVTEILSRRRRGPKATDRYPLTGLVRCVSCEGQHTLSGSTGPRRDASGRRKRMYICAASKGGCSNSMLADALEATVREVMLRTTTDKELSRDLSRKAAAANDERARLLDEISDAKQAQADLAEKYAVGEIPKSRWDGISARVGARLATAEARLKELGAPKSGPMPAVTAEDWDNATSAEQRTLVRDAGLQITLRKSLTRGKGDPDRLQIS
jgi:site-specific DNA recombinase